MPSYSNFAQVFALNPEKPDLIVFIGCCPNEETTKNLFDIYKTRTLVCGPEHLPTMNSSYAKLFVTNTASMESIHTYEHLWRVAKEGSRIMILLDPNVPLADYTGYGFKEVLPGTLSFAPYDVAIVRKDCSVHFRK